MKWEPRTERQYAPDGTLLRERIQYTPDGEWQDVKEKQTPDMVNHPPHYKTGGIETIDYIEAKQFDFHLGNAIKYISRAEHKGTYVQDLQKAIWYLNRAIEKEQS